MKLAASYPLGHPNWHRPGPGLCPRCEEEIETTEHALLLCLARQYARESFPETLNLKSACVILQTEGLEGLVAWVEETYGVRLLQPGTISRPMLEFLYHHTISG